MAGAYGEGGRLVVSGEGMGKRGTYGSVASGGEGHGEDEELHEEEDEPGEEGEMHCEFWGSGFAWWVCGSTVDRAAGQGSTSREMRAGGTKVSGGESSA